MHSRLQLGHIEPFQAIIQRGIQRGELPKNTDAALLIAALVGPLFYRRWFSRELLTGSFVNGLIRQVIAPQ